MRAIRNGEVDALIISGVGGEQIFTLEHAEQEIVSLAKFPSENPNPVLRLSRDGTVMYANPASGALLGLLGCAVGGPAPQFWRDLVTQALASRENNHIDIECDGKVYSMFVTPVAETGYVNLYGRDITERKQTEEELRRSEEKYRDLVNALNDGVFVSDDRGVLTFANQALARMHGFEHPEELVGRPFIEFVAPAMVGNIAQVFRESIQNGTTSETIEVEIIRPNGIGAFIEIKPVPIGENGKVMGIRGVVRDITERKQHEREVEAIAAVSAALRSVLTRAEMLPVILDQVMELFQASGAVLVIPDPSSGELMVEMARGEGEKASQVRIPAGSGVPGRVIESGQPYLNNAALEDPLFETRDLFPTVHALAGMPLSVKGSPIGVLLVGRAADISPADLRLMNSIADIAANALYRASLFEQTEQRLKYMTAVQQIDSAINSSLDLRVTFNVLLARMLEQLHADAGDVLLFDPHLHCLDYLSGRGFLTTAVESTHLKMGECLAGRAALERRSAFISDLAKSTYPLRSGGQLAVEKFVAYHALPLIAKGEVKGVLEVYYRVAHTPEADALNLLETITGQAAIAIDNAQLFQSLQRSNIDLILAYDATIEGWSYALDLRVKETEGHTRRVTEMAERLAAALGLTWEEQSQVRRGSLLHDIGKMSLPDHILLKEGPLTEEEKAILHQHPQLALDMLSPIAYLRRALDVPYCHHEKWDGTGYPRRLKGSQIPLAARIFTVVDEWDAITTARPNLPALTKEQAIQHIRECTGVQFDPQVVEAFLGLIGNNG